MKNYLKKYEMLWDIVSQLNWNPSIPYEEVKLLLLENLSKEQSAQLLKEFEEVEDLLRKNLSKSLLKKHSKLEEENELAITSNIIGLGFDTTLTFLSEGDSAWKTLPEDILNTNFAQEIPYDFEYEEDENDIQKMFKRTLDKLLLIKSATHLSEDYKKEIELKINEFIDSVKNVYNGEEVTYDQNEYYKQIEDFNEFSKWARDVVEDNSKNRFDRSNMSNHLIGYDYPHAIKEYKTRKKLSNKKITANKYDQYYIEEFSKKNVLNFLEIKNAKKIKSQTKPKV